MFIIFINNNTILKPVIIFIYMLIKQKGEIGDIEKSNILINYYYIKWIYYNILINNILLIFL